MCLTGISILGKVFPANVPHKKIIKYHPHVRRLSRKGGSWSCLHVVMQPLRNMALFICGLHHETVMHMSISDCCIYSASINVGFLYDAVTWINWILESKRIFRYSYSFSFIFLLDSTTLPWWHQFVDDTSVLIHRLSVCLHGRLAFVFSHRLPQHEQIYLNDI